MAVQIVSVLLYHVLPQGAFTARELQAAGMVQTDLGTYLKESLPLTFATAGTGVRAVPCKAPARDRQCALQRLSRRAVCLPILGMWWQAEPGKHGWRFRSVQQHDVLCR